MDVQPGREPPSAEPTRRELLRRRYWAYANSPYPGLGCLWPLLLFVLICWLLSLLFPLDGV